MGYFTVFVPDCNENGDYKPVQCDYRYGYCWCSDENGNPVPGTTVRGKANCTAPGNIFISFISGFCPLILEEVYCVTKPEGVKFKNEQIGQNCRDILIYFTQKQQLEND